MNKLCLALFIFFIFIIGCQPAKDELAHYENIRLNQLGYYQKSIKQFIIADTKASSFAVVDQSDKAVYDGKYVGNASFSVAQMLLLLEQSRKQKIKI